MLSESVLEELSRNTPVQAPLVKSAWTSLTTESKLQLIQAIQGTGSSRSTPDWLTDLALADPAPIVRFWAARFAYFKDPLPPGAFSIGAPPTEADLARKEAALNDADPLVRACATKPSLLLGYEDLTPLTQIGRLLTIRHAGFPDFAGFIDWLEQALTVGVPVEEIQECAHEFFSQPSLAKEFSTPEAHQDIHTAHQMGKAMEKSWALVKTAPAVIQATLAYCLPLQVGEFTKMKVETLATLPDLVLERLLFMTSADSPDVLITLRNRVLEHPEQFSTKIVERLNRQDDDYGHPGPEEIRRRQLLDRRDPAKATLEALADVLDRFDGLEGRLTTLEENLQNKKGLIW